MCVCVCACVVYVYMCLCVCKEVLIERGRLREARSERQADIKIAREKIYIVSI